MNPVIQISTIALLLSLAGIAPGQAAEGSEVLYHQRGAMLRDGVAGRIIELQDGVNKLLAACGSNTRIKADSKFGAQTTLAIKELANCPLVASKVTDIDPLRAGAVSNELWDLATEQRPRPTVQERTRALLIAFEGTDYVDAEWNFCQNLPFYKREVPNSPCYSNDKSSFLTWGPNGATAGHGHEIQVISRLVDKKDPSVITRAFGAEADAFRRSLTLNAAGTNADLEFFLCGVWLDETRAKAWKAAFAQFGQDKVVQKIFDAVYFSRDFDGGKMLTFVNAWRNAGLTPTEVDYAFFIDRTTHTSGSSASTLASVLSATLKELGTTATAAKIRRGVALRLTPGNSDQALSRLGRDVTFYADELEKVLNPREANAWADRGRRRASDVGLSDARPGPVTVAGPSLSERPKLTGKLSADEKKACPATVLNPLSPP